ncbi:hypothetical protein HZR84_00805 [Hyphobacterium sp. CCMP332]|nr:hypothetical protein HZR84_00805 [Hyphobacterium sp. CCMP332]
MNIVVYFIVLHISLTSYFDKNLLFGGYYEDSQNTYTVVDNAFSSSPFDSEKVKNKIIEDSFNLSVDTLLNTHFEGEINILLRYSKNQDCVANLIQSKDKTFIVEVMLMENCFKLEKDINIGMTGAELFNIWEINKTHIDTLHISDDESWNNHYFIVKNDSLKEIHFNFGFD